MSEELWPAPPAQVAELIQRVARLLLPESSALAEEFAESSLRAFNEPAILADPSLSRAELLVNQLNTVQWLTSNIHRPGRRVEPYLGVEALDYARDLVRRGIAPDHAGSWRAAQVVAWRRWVAACLSLCSDPGLLIDLLGVSEQSINQFAADTIRATDAAIAQEVAELNSGAEARRLATINLVLEGAPIARVLAEEALAYGLARDHTAAIIWTEDVKDSSYLSAATSAICSEVGTHTALVVKASATTRWTWLPTAEAPTVASVLRSIGETRAVRVALGQPGFGVEGFRTSHAEAMAAQRVLVRLSSPRRVARYSELRMVDTLTADMARAESFITQTLGELACAARSLRQPLLAYIQCGFNASRVAADLYVHRNTIERRLTRANELLAIKLEQNPTEVAAALMIVDLRDPH